MFEPLNRFSNEKFLNHIQSILSITNSSVTCELFKIRTHQYLHEKYLWDLIFRFNFLQESDPVFYQHLYGILFHLLNSPCILSLVTDNSCNKLPILYVSSGIFTSNQNSFLWQRNLF